MPEAAGINYAISSGGSPTGAPPLVLIHGAGGSRLHWPPDLRRLEGRTVYSIDLPGHGRSKGSVTDRIDGYADGVSRWMEAVDLPSAIVAGHSMGGAIAQQLAYGHRQRLAGLILIGTGNRLPVNTSLLELTSSAKTFPQATELIIRWQFSRQVDPDLVELAQESMDNLDHRVMHADLVACSQFDLSGRDPQVDLAGLPTLVICGQEDKMTPLAMSQALVDTIPQAEMVTVSSAGHMVMLEKPAEVTGAIQSFLNQHNL